MSKSIVTGGAGFIGSHIVEKLISLNHHVVCIDNEYSDNDSFYWNKKAENHKKDITEINSIRPLFKGVDFVFHCAAESRIGPAIENPTNATFINVVGTCNVLQCARENKIKKVKPILRLMRMDSRKSILNSHHCRELALRHFLGIHNHFTFEFP